VNVDDDLDDRKYVKERLKYLVTFIAHRDGEDVRPALKAGKLNLEDLEEIYVGGFDPEETEPVPEDKAGKGKGKGKLGHTLPPQR
jgi:hypothetical protein